MKRLIFLLLVFFLISCGAPAQTQPEPRGDLPVTSSLPDKGEAPELTNDVWLNTDAPLRLADLRDSVVLIDMWTFG